MALSSFLENIDCCVSLTVALFDHLKWNRNTLLWEHKFIDEEIAHVISVFAQRIYHEQCANKTLLTVAVTEPHLSLANEGHKVVSQTLETQTLRETKYQQRQNEANLTLFHYISGVC